jgi:hypothetical protein
VAAPARLSTGRRVGRSRAFHNPDPPPARHCRRQSIQARAPLPLDQYRQRVLDCPCRPDRAPSQRCSHQIFPKRTPAEGRGRRRAPRPLDGRGRRCAVGLGKAPGTPRKGIHPSNLCNIWFGAAHQPSVCRHRVGACTPESQWRWLGGVDPQGRCLPSWLPAVHHQPSVRQASRRLLEASSAMSARGGSRGAERLAIAPREPVAIPTPVIYSAALRSASRALSSKARSSVQ